MVGEGHRAATVSWRNESLGGRTGESLGLVWPDALTATFSGASGSLLPGLGHLPASCSPFGAQLSSVACGRRSRPVCAAAAPPLSPPVPCERPELGAGLCPEIGAQPASSWRPWGWGGGRLPRPRTPCSCREGPRGLLCVSVLSPGGESLASFPLPSTYPAPGHYSLRHPSPRALTEPQGV